MLTLLERHLGGLSQFRPRAEALLFHFELHSSRSSKMIQLPFGVFRVSMEARLTPKRGFGALGHPLCTRCTVEDPNPPLCMFSKTNSRIQEMAVIGQPFCCTLELILVDICLHLRNIGACYCLSLHIVSSSGMRFAAVRLE